MNQHATQVIEAIGGTAAVAKLCGVSMPSVSDWKKSGIPRARMMFLQAVKAKELEGIDLEAATSSVSSASTPESSPAEESPSSTPTGEVADV